MFRAGAGDGERGARTEPASRNGCTARGERARRVTRRQVLAGTTTGLAAGLAGCSEGWRGEPSATPAFDAFVGVDGTDFVVDGEVFHPLGGNHPQLRKQSTDDQSAWLDQWLAAVPGLTVLRATAFGTGRARTDHPLQPEPGQPGEEGFRRLDALIAACGERGVRLVLPLANYWDWQGGIPQYVAWSDGATERNDFYTDRQCQEWYRAHVENVLTRENTVTGIEYRDDPTIAMWELCNEPRGGEDVLGWVGEAASHVRSIDDRHLLSTGMDGSLEDPTHSERAHARDGIDAYSLHVWADAGEGHGGAGPAAGVEAIRAHAETAQDVGLPLYVGEFGWPVDRTDDEPDADELRERDRVFAAYFLAMREAGAAGSLVWDLRHDAEYPLDWDIYGVFPRDEGTTGTVADAYASFGEPPGTAAATASPASLSVSLADETGAGTAVVPRTGGGVADEPAFELRPEGETYASTDDGETTGPEDCSATFRLGYDDEHLYLRADVTDDVHAAGSGESLWRRDSIQWATAHEGTYGPEYGLSHADGPHLHRWFAGRAARDPTAVEATTDRSGSTTTYGAAVPWLALFPTRPEPGDAIPFSVLVNDNDGEDDARDGVLGWTLPGIDDRKTPAALGRVVLDAEGVTPWQATVAESQFIVRAGEVGTWEFRVSNYGSDPAEFEVAAGDGPTRTVEVPGGRAAIVTVERAFAALGGSEVRLVVTETASGEMVELARPVMVVG